MRQEAIDLDRYLATVLFTDIVDSTSVAASVGDREWRSLVEAHHRILRGALARYRGVEMDTAGDGFFATFDGPARAIRCALAIADAAASLGMGARAGLHTGECDVTSETIGGPAVQLGESVARLASSG